MSLMWNQSRILKSHACPLAYIYIYMYINIHMCIYMFNCFELYILIYISFSSLSFPLAHSSVAMQAHINAFFIVPTFPCVVPTFRCWVRSSSSHLSLRSSEFFFRKKKMSTKKFSRNFRTFFHQIFFLLKTQNFFFL